MEFPGECAGRIISLRRFYLFDPVSAIRQEIRRGPCRSGLVCGEGCDGIIFNIGYPVYDHRGIVEGNDAELGALQGGSALGFSAVGLTVPFFDPYPAPDHVLRNVRLIVSSDAVLTRGDLLREDAVIGKIAFGGFGLLDGDCAEWKNCLSV